MLSLCNYDVHGLLLEVNTVALGCDVDLSKLCAFLFIVRLAYARYCYRHSVCPSVFLSVKRMYCDKTK